MIECRVSFSFKVRRDLYIEGRGVTMDPEDNSRCFRLGRISSPLLSCCTPTGFVFKENSPLSGRKGAV